MKSLYDSLPEYIKSGDYFTDARNWYKYKYVHPFSQKSFMILLSLIISILFFVVMMTMKSLFPSVMQVRYSINADTSLNKSTQIIRADEIDNDPLASVVDIMLKNYVIKRESYNYNNLGKQFIYLKNNSTRLVFRRFSSFMSLDNPDSPVLALQKNAKRFVKIISASFPNPTKAIIEFSATANTPGGKNIENKVWQATVSYEIDKINSDLPNGTRFNFTVTDYELQLLEDKTSK